MTEAVQIIETGRQLYRVGVQGDFASSKVRQYVAAPKHNRRYPPPRSQKSASPSVVFAFNRPQRGIRRRRLSGRTACRPRSHPTSEAYGVTCAIPVARPSWRSCGLVRAQEDVLVRIHSTCVTRGSSVRCVATVWCLLRESLCLIRQVVRGGVIYFRDHKGRGSGWETRSAPTLSKTFPPNPLLPCLDPTRA